MISGSTKLIGIVGHPIAQVQMPSNLNPFFAETSKDIVMIPFDVAPNGLSHFIGMLRASRNILGTVVTVPHKQAVARQVDALTGRAQALGAVNVVRRESDGTLQGDHVDGFGFLNAAREHGFKSAGKNALVIGAGGAGSAIAYALCESNISSLTILDTDASRVHQIAQMVTIHFPNVEIKTSCVSLAGLDLLANVTPVGMKEQDPMPLPQALLDTLTASTLVCDAITSPSVTSFLQFARERGCRIQTGSEMSRASVQFIGSFLRFLPEIDPVAAISVALK